MSAIPSHTNVLVIGGGPGGAYTATVLARENVEVTVLEAAQFPRYHIGESMLPSINHFYEYIGAEEKLRGFGFAKKVGAAAKFKQNKREAYTNFIEHDPRNAAVNVIRSDLDELLLRHAQESGATVFEQTRVTDIVFEEGRDPVRSDNPRPVGVNYVKKDGSTGYITFDYLVDASGTKGLMSTKYLRNRKMNHTLHNIACWGYWSGTGMYMPGTDRHNAPWFESLTDESGWVWFIPLHNGTVSVGFVMDMEVTIQKKAALREKNSDEYSLKAHYLDQLQYAPGLQDLLKNATFKSEGGDSGVKSASDFSYSANFYAGDHYRLVGDAAAFIDPFFSSGVHLAHIGGLSAAVSICASIKKQCTELEAAKYHDMRVSRSYTRFLMVVLSAYKQIRSQTGDYLSTPEEDNYDRAFDFYRPIILGTADVGAKITQDELEKALDFCAGVLFPGDPELKDSVGTHIGFDLLKASGPMTGYDAGEAKIDAGDDTFGTEKSDGKTIALHAALDAIAKDKIDGFVPNLTRGSLGLTKDAGM